MPKTEKIVIQKHGNGYMVSKTKPLTPLIDFRADRKESAFNEWGSISIECSQEDPETVHIKLMAYQSIRPHDPKQNLVAGIHLTPDEIKQIAEKAQQVCIEQKGGVYFEQNDLDVLRAQIHDLKEEKKGFLIRIEELEKQLRLQEG
jgi:hypothetical protein